MSYVFPVLQVFRLKLGKPTVIASCLRLSGNNHAIESVVSLEYLWVTEIKAVVSVVRTVELPHIVACPGLEVWRGSAHHHLAVLASAVLASIVDVVKAVCLIIVTTACTEGCILLVVTGTGRQDFAQGGVVCSVFCCHCPIGVETVCLVLGIVLQIEHLELVVLCIVERHRVAHAAYVVLRIDDTGNVEGTKALLVSRIETVCGATPILLWLWIWLILFVA